MSKEKEIYLNISQCLSKYITKAQFDGFYARIKNSSDNSSDSVEKITANTHKNYDELSKEQLSHIEFYIKSSEITPAIDGYIAVAMPIGMEIGDIGLVGYIPLDFISLSIS